MNIANPARLPQGSPNGSCPGFAKCFANPLTEMMIGTNP
jgi:hypothetical protein